MTLNRISPDPFPAGTLTKLPRRFYTRPTLRVARELLGKYLIRQAGGRLLAGMITEVEAYLGEKDPASHAFRGRTKRNEVMFYEGGHLYVYFTYGMHHCCNVVTERAGLGRAVLIRAIEPVAGIGTMSRNRGVECESYTGERTRPGAPGTGRDPGLTNGPAKLCQAMGISLKENGADLTGDGLYIASADRPGRQRLPSAQRPPEVLPRNPGRIAATTRIGIRHGTHHKWRFFIAGNRFVSRAG